MTDKIKLMSKGQEKEFVFQFFEGLDLFAVEVAEMLAERLVDECEKRAVEVAREVAERFFERGNDFGFDGSLDKQGINFHRNNPTILYYLRS